jgi:hypothetical protein
MPSRLRFTLLLALVALAFGLVACGGDDGDAASEDVDTLLEETFSGDKNVDSGNLSLKLELDAEGGDLQGPVTVTLSGPFQTEGENELPKFDFDVSFEGAGQSFSAGATSTGDKGFVSFQGTDYAVTDEIFQQFKQGFEQAQSQSQGDEQSLADFGIDPRNWLTNAKNEGASKVGDDETVKITGGVDVDKLLDDIDKTLPEIRKQAQGAGEIPDRLTSEQRQAVRDAVKDIRVEIHTGAEDKILRRLALTMSITPPANTEGVDVQSADISFDLSLTGVNEDQSIEAPEDTKPLDELLGQLGGLGLGGLGGAGGSGSGSSGSGSGGAAPDAQALEEYSNCVRDAGNDAAKAQKCAELLTP